MKTLRARLRTGLKRAGSWFARIRSKVRERKAIVFVAIVVPVGTLLAAVLGDDNPFAVRHVLSFFPSSRDKVGDDGATNEGR